MPKEIPIPTVEMPEKKTLITSSVKTNHFFKYQKNGVSLEFTLSPENIQDFKDILTQALQDLTVRL